MDTTIADDYQLSTQRPVSFFPLTQGRFVTVQNIQIFLLEVYLINA